MKHSWLSGLLRTVTVLTALAAGTLDVHATTTDIASVPLGTSPAAAVLPNLMFVLDDSGSMGWNYTPDEVNDNNNCKTCSSGSCTIANASCADGDPPYYSNFNLQYYNPAVVYKSAVNYLSVALGNMTPTGVRNNPYSSTDLSTTDVVNNYLDLYYCTTAANSPTPSAAQFNSTTFCKRNGIDTPNPFNYATQALPDTTFRVARSRSVSNPYYYAITPTEFCTDASMTTCTASTVATAVAGITYATPAPVRWCSTQAATSAATSATAGLCRALVNNTFKYGRYGTYKRVDILSGNSYDRTAARTDCTGTIGVGNGGCTYTQELQNFANWYGYYRLRILQMKTVSGRVFSTLDDRYRIGFLTINASSSAKYLPIAKFETTPTTQKQDWFTKFYAQSPNSSTPLRTALSRVGRHYAGMHDGINSFMPEDPIQFSCQRNYTLLTTDGYWNGGSGQKMDGSTMDDQDDTPGIWVSRESGTLDGVGTVVTQTTPVQTLQQQICVGNAQTTFPGNNQACGCSGNQTRVVQQTKTVSTNVQFIDGVGQTPTVGTAYTFQNITACTTPSIITTVTPVSVTEHAKCTSSNNATFVNGNTSACGCSTVNLTVGGVTVNNVPQTRIKQRVTDNTSTSINTDGVIVNSALNTSVFSNFTSCTTPLVQSTVTPLTDREQVKCVGAGNATFSANGSATTTTPCGCTGVQTSIKQRTVARSNTVVTTDGAATSNTTSTGTAGGTTFQTITACTTPLIVTTVTPITDTEQAKCVGAGNATFSANGTATTTVACGCAGIQTRIKQRAVARTSTTITTDGVITSGPTVTTGTPGGTTFSDFTGCTTPLVVTAVTHTRTVEQQVLTGPTASTFANVNGVAYVNTVSSCVANQARIRQRQTDYDTTVVTTDGVAAAPTTSGTAYITTDNACVNLTNTVVQPLRETATLVFPEASPANTNFAASVTNASIAPNPQFSYTCTGAGVRTVAITRTMDYNRTTVTVGAGAPTITFSNLTSAASFGQSACDTSGKAPVAPAVANNGAASSNTTTGAPVAAATTNTNTPQAPTNNGGTNLAVTLVPNPNTVNGAPVPSNNGGTNIAAPLTPNPQTTSGAGVVANTGTNLTITLAPNPNTVSGTPVVTNNGGTTVVIPLSPNPSVPVTLTTTATTTSGGTPDTLADVAMYYYKTDLRTSGAVSADNVPKPGGGTMHQHMVTFTLGLGLDGEMIYDPNYETASSGDFFKIKSSATGCSWTTGTCNWPVPVADTPTALDDLWHAAVNGRGKYFSAKDPTTLENGLTSTLAAINEATGAASSAATSTPNLTPTDNLLFSSTYRTDKWDGEVIAQRLDPTTGNLLPAIEWSAANQLNARASSATDTRTIYTLDTAASSGLKPFLYANLSPTEQAYFNNKCNAPGLPQCSVFVAAADGRVATANLGNNLVNWLRGQNGNELSIDLSTGLYRNREFLLGDTVNSKPVFQGPPNLALADAVTPDYSTFKAVQASRQKVLYISANDGMLHAFNADTGAEMWAYVPKMVMPNMWKLASKDYGTGHIYSVDGSPATMDVFLSGAWRTVLVSGLNGGGRGFFALDITDPNSPKGMWEICSDATLCDIADADMGLSYALPVIGKRPDGTPVVIVTSGYNNATPGNGGGYLYVLDALKGTLLEKIGTEISGTNVGSITTPSGFAKITGFARNFAQDNTATIIYGGDLLGNVWRFDMTVSPVTVQRLATLKDGSTPAKPQSISTRPEITQFNTGYNVLYFGTGRLLGSTDLVDPATLAPPEPFAYQNTIYAIKDTGTDLGDLRLAAANTVQQVMTVAGSSRGVSNNNVDLDVKNGWYLDLNPASASPGERVNLDPTLVKGVLIVTSNQPNNDACSDVANGFLYQIDYRTGSYIPGTPGGVLGGQISSSLLVGSVFYRTTTGALVGLSRSSTGTPIKTPVSSGGVGGTGQRVSWRELVQ